LTERVAGRRVHLDFGTGDGAYVLRAARASVSSGSPSADLFIGVDANASALREVSRRALAKPARGGAPNAMFGVLSLENAPGELAELVDHLTVLLPWGSLLRAVAQPDAAALGRLLALLRRGSGRFRFVFGYGSDDRDVAELPSLDAANALDVLVERYRAAGLDAIVRAIDVSNVRALRTTWANKLAFSDHARRFIDVTGTFR
jgi:16S rRNA (adenine(1408)-N(1))-methyltransferase